MKKSKFYIVPYPVDTNKFIPIKKNHEDKKIKTLLFVAFGKIERNRKGLDLFEKIVEKLKFEKINIIIVGKVDKKKFINKNCNFIFHEYIKNIEDMSKIFSSADVFIFTSRIDNFPNVALEAQSCGLPIICFSSGGVTEINKNNYTGFVIKSFSVKNFVTKINSLISNDYLLKKFSQNSRRNALKNYSYKVISKKYNKILHDIS